MTSVPAHAVGLVDVTVATDGGTSATSTADHYTYVTAPTVTAVAPARGPVAGGNQVVITGTGFFGGTGASNVSAVKFGTTAVAGGSYLVNSDTQITVSSTPAHGAGAVDVTVTNDAGSSAANTSGCPSSSPCDQFTYVDDAQWSGWNFLAGSVTGPAVATNADGRLEAFGLSPDHTAWHTWQGTAGGAFTGSASLGGSLGSSPSVGRNADGRLEIFAQSSGGSVIHNWQNSAGGGWSGWFGLGGGIVGTPTVATDADGRLELLVLAHDNTAYHAWQTSPGSGWTGWYPLGGSLASVPSAGLNADGRLEIFAKGTDGSAVHAWQTAANAGWSGWSSLGGQISGTPSVGTNADGRLEMFVTAPDSQTFGTNLDGMVYEQVQGAVNGSWTGWSSIGGPSLVRVTTGTNLDGRIELIAQDSAGSLWHNSEPSPPT